MTHPGNETLLAHVDGELTPRESLALAEHMSRCTTCSAAAAGLRETSTLFAGALRTIDDDEPASWQAPSARSTDEIPFAPRVSGAQRRSAGRRIDAGWLRRAAVFLLVTAAAGSAAVIGGRALFTPEEPTGSQTVQGAATTPTVAAVSIVPAGGAVEVVLTATAGVRVHVTLAAVAEANVAVENATAPHVTVEGNRVRVEVSDAGATVRVTLPHDLRRADIVSAGAPLIRVRNGVVTPGEAAAGGIVIGAGTQSDP